MLVIGYWNIKGRLEDIRLILAYLNIPYEERNPPTIQSWFEETKFNLGLPFPNLPYLIHDGLKLTNSHAIMRYIVQKFGRQDLLGKTKEDRVQVTQIKGVI